MAKSTKQITWRDRDGQSHGFVEGALRFSIRWLPKSRVWVLAKPDRMGLFESAGTFASADEAKRSAEAA